jgi:hypothetical protein
VRRPLSLTGGVTMSRALPRGGPIPPRTAVNAELGTVPRPHPRLQTELTGRYESLLDSPLYLGHGDARRLAEACRLGTYRPRAYETNVFGVVAKTNAFMPLLAKGAARPLRVGYRTVSVYEPPLRRISAFRSSRN